MPLSHTPFSSSPFYILPIVFVASLSGCGGGLENINIRDNNSPSGTLRVNKNIGPKFSLNAEVSSFEGSDKQELFDFESLDIENQDIDGPGFIENDYEFITAAVIADFLALDSRHVTIHIGGGLYYSDLTMNVLSDQGNTITLEEDAINPTVQFRIELPVTDRLTGGFRVLATDPFDEVSMVSNTIELNYRLTNNVNVFAGWYSNNYRNESHRSDINIDSRGARYGIGFNF